MTHSISRPLLLGHRGVRPLRRLGLRSSGPEVPEENTLGAFEYAMASGCDGFEMDVRFTRDRRSVVHHDPHLSGSEIAATERSGLQRRRYNLASLEDVLACFGGSAYLDIELKVGGHEQEVVAAVRANPPARGYVLSSFLADVLWRLHDLDSSLPLGYICEHAEDAELWTQLPIAVFIPQHTLVSQRLVDEIHQRGLQLLAWTVNWQGELLRLASWGVDGLISDDPKLLSRTFGPAPGQGTQPD